MCVTVWCNRWFDSVREWEKQMAANPSVPVYVAVYEEAIRVRKTLWGGHEGMWLCIRRPLGCVSLYGEAMRVCG